MTLRELLNSTEIRDLVVAATDIKTGLDLGWRKPEDALDNNVIRIEPAETPSGRHVVLVTVLREYDGISSYHLFEEEYSEQ